MRGHVSPEREVPAHIQRPPYAAEYDHPGWSDHIEVHDQQAHTTLWPCCMLPREKRIPDVRVADETIPVCVLALLAAMRNQPCNY